MSRLTWVLPLYIAGTLAATTRQLATRQRGPVPPDLAPRAWPPSVWTVGAAALSALLILRLGSSSDPGFLTLLFLAAIPAFLLAGASSFDGLLDAIVAATVAILAFPVGYLLMMLPGASPPVDQAVGWSGYTGYPKFHDYVASAGILASAALAAWAGARFRSPRVVKSEAPPALRPNWKQTAVHAAVLLVVATLFQPDLRGAIVAARTQLPQLHGWDDVMQLAWGAFVSSGLRPFRDFWYPFAGFYLYFLPMPWSKIFGWFHVVALIAFLYAGLLFCAGRRPGRAILLFALVMVPLWVGLFPNWIRYLLAIDVVLLYARVADGRAATWRWRVVFGALAGYAFFCEAAQLAYGIGGAVLIAGLAAARDIQSSPRERSRRTLLGEAARRFLSDVIAPATAGALVVAAFLARQGMLEGFIGFYGSLGVQAIYGGLQSDLSSWMVPVLGPNSVFLVLVMVTAVALRRWLAQAPGDREALVALLLVCAAGLAVVQKQVMRPHIMNQVHLFVYVAGLLYAVLIWPRRTRAQAAVAGVFMGGLVAAGAARPEPFDWLQRMAAAPGRAASNYAILVHRRADARDAPTWLGRLAEMFPREASVVALLRQQPGFRATDEVFVLSDDPVFYLFLGQRPPYHVNNFTMSAIAEQQRTVAWLEEQRPRFVLWNSGAPPFDDVPNHVRLPLVYTYVVEHYTPIAASEGFDLLERGDARPAASGYWRTRLGDAVDLGHVVERSQPDAYSTCVESMCSPVLVVDAKPLAPARSIAEVTVKSRGSSWSVRFHLTPHRQAYVINLQRLWFWRFASAEMLPEITVGEGLTARLEMRRVRSGVLY